ncbi:hypothetical protein ACEPAF_6712 [Sanghuangporus sanghuang]
MSSFPDEKTFGKHEGHATEEKIHEASSEAHGVSGAPPPHSDLKRQLKNRHIAMISIGGVIGTGLFLGTATSLRNGGPLGLLLGYLVVGSICFSVMISLGEMVAYLPIPGGHIKLAERFVDPALSFTMGWNYWYNWTIILPAELVAAALLMSYWKSDDEVNSAVWITMCLVIVIVINLFGAGVYGECEFIFASIKVITITGLIILGIVIDLGGGPNHDRIGFRYWDHPGPFVQFNGIAGAKGRFLGWWAVMTQAAFSFIGTEIVAIAAGEAKNPRRNLPKAIKRVYVRILLFYIGGTFIIGLLVPSDHPDLNLASETAAASPFVIAIQTAGIKGLPHAINAAFLTSAWSAASSDLYTSSRALYGLALSGNAPKIFTRTTSRGLPLLSILFCTAFSFLSYMSVSSGAGKVFNWFVNMTAVAGLMTWFGISVTYIRFHAGFVAQGLDRSTLPYASKLNPFAAWYAAISCIVICFFSGWDVFLKDSWDTATFVTNYLPFMLFPFLYISSSLYYKRRPLKAMEMDFVSGLKEIEAMTYDDPPPRNWVERFWGWLLIAIEATFVPFSTVCHVVNCASTGLPNSDLPGEEALRVIPSSLFRVYSLEVLSSIPVSLPWLGLQVPRLTRRIMSFNPRLSPHSVFKMRSRSDTQDYGEPPPSASSSATSILSADYTLLNSSEIEDALVDLAHPYTGVLDLESSRKADGLSFQPCATARCQDRYIIEQFAVRGTGNELWTLTGVFDGELMTPTVPFLPAWISTDKRLLPLSILIVKGHLGEATVEHVAHHLPVIVQEFLAEAVSNRGPASLKEPAVVSAALKRAFISFDRDIANDVLELFPGGIASLERLSDDYIRSVINDYSNGLQNYKKVRLNMYGTTALLAIVDPLQENLWIANLGDCEAVLASRTPSGRWVGELLTQVHNGTNLLEVERVRREHPNEPGCVRNGRILGTIAPFRCIGDQPFKQPAAFTSRILFNLDAGTENVDSSRAAWAQLIDRVRTPPYLSADPDVAHSRLNRGSNAFAGVPNQFLVLCTDGLPDLLETIPPQGHPQYYVDAVIPPGTRNEQASFRLDDNIALRILKKALGGEDNNAVSQMISLQSDQPWLDDVTIIVQILVLANNGWKQKQRKLCQSRTSSSSTSAGEENAPSDPDSKPSSFRQPQVYLDSERKRKLISLYHQAERFVHPNNISEYIDKEFHRGMDRDMMEEESRYSLERVLDDRRRSSKTFILTEGYTPLASRNVGLTSTDRRNLIRHNRVKAALFGLDDSSKVGLEAVDKRRHGMPAKPKQPSD